MAIPILRWNRSRGKPLVFYVFFSLAFTIIRYPTPIPLLLLNISYPMYIASSMKYGRVSMVVSFGCGGSSPHFPSERNLTSHASSRVYQARFLFPQKPLSVLLAQRRCIHFVHFCEGTSAGLGVLLLFIISSLFYCIILLIPLPRICLICGVFDYNIDLLIAERYHIVSDTPRTSQSSSR